MSERKDDCHICTYKRSTPLDCYISCAKPDPEMEGNPIGINSGGFHYPLNFDPIWKKKECSNFKELVKKH